MAYKAIDAKYSLANDEDVHVVGYVDVYVKLGPLRRKHRALVVDLPSMDAVIGLDFMTLHDISLRCKK